ncbi:hypothetical protein TNCV_3313701 [Trichonephila clavipes]|nr:hypothetical protein TNCV_3313701 [Trichonephila clavipes]
MGCSKVLISQGLDLFSVPSCEVRHSAVTAKNSSGVSVSLFRWISRKSVGVTMLLTGFIFYVKIMLLKSEGPSGKAFPEGSFKFMSQLRMMDGSDTVPACISMDFSEALSFVVHPQYWTKAGSALKTVK